jgi:hypothetical protein
MAGVILGCFLAGAAGTYVVSNWRVRVEPSGGPDAWAADAPSPHADPNHPPPLPPPNRLPDTLTGAESPTTKAIRDPAVRPAEGTAPADVPANPKAKATGVTETVSYVPGDTSLKKNVSWPAPVKDAPPFLIGRKAEVTFDKALPTGMGKLKVRFDATGGQKIEPKEVPVPPAGWFAVDGNKATIDFDDAVLTKFSGLVTIQVNDDTPTPFGIIYLNVPMPATDKRVNLTAFRTTPLLPLTPFASTTPSQNLYSAPTGTFLQLQGQTFGPAVSAVRVFTLKDNAAPVELAPEKPTPAGAVWSFTAAPRSPALAANEKGTLLVRAEFADGHAYTVLGLPYAVVPGLAVLPTPKVTLTRLTPDETGALKPDTVAVAELALPGTTAPIFPLNTRTVRLTVTPPDEPADAQGVVVSLDGKVEAQSINRGADSKVQAANTFDLTVPTDGDHTVTVEISRGAERGPARTLALKVRTEGPRVTGVSSDGLGQGSAYDPAKITIQFSPNNPLNPATATVIANYKVVLNEFLAAGVSGTPPLQADVAVDRAAFDPVANTVTLYTRKGPPGLYTVAVLNPNKDTTKGVPGVKDLYGNFLIPSFGPAAERAYQQVLSTVPPGKTPEQAAAEAALPSVSVGVNGTTLQPAVNAQLPEYLPPLSFPEGFNPADKVETRVVRLFYYRDAHRVAQIVNRDVRSYNRATVDVRRRAADRARDDAEKATAQRQQLEQAAVRAAEAARAAETDLNKLQNQQASARRLSAESGVLLRQKQAQLEQANRILPRAETEAPLRQPLDDRVVAQQNYILDLEARQAVLPKLIDATGEAQRKADLQAEKERIDRGLPIERDRLALLRQQAANRADAGADPQRQSVTVIQQDIDTIQRTISSADAADRTAGDQLRTAQDRVATARQAAATADDARRTQEREETRLRAEQFRLEVAAAREDPDTYAPGDVKSPDPVLRCSISVIGEGLIQIRGPVKGLNVIRTMINEIDSPQGQVRVAMHTIQVNGERGNRMEKVVANIQRYLDHSRFLTVQSSQMLRKAVTLVASRKAQEVEAQLGPGCTQADRDQKYMYAFFGKDFIDELILLDSEFLKTGNKVLSLHSMDSTSLSSALFLMSLAKNEVRREIIYEFMGLIQQQLPVAEQEYYLAGLSGNKCDACCDKQSYLLAYNARFASFLGFFDAEVLGNDTLTPVQREFVKLAQIFKARLVTEMQYRQRVLERSLVEERFATQTYKQVLQAADRAEQEAKQKLQEALAARQQVLAELSTTLLTSVAQGTGDVRSAEGQAIALAELVSAQLPTPPALREQYDRQNKEYLAKAVALDKSKDRLQQTEARMMDLRKHEVLLLPAAPALPAAAPLAAAAQTVLQDSINKAAETIASAKVEVTKATQAKDQAAASLAQVQRELDAAKKDALKANNTQLVANLQNAITGYRKFRFEPQLEQCLTDLGGVAAAIQQAIDQEVKREQAATIRKCLDRLRASVDGELRRIQETVNQILRDLSADRPDTRKAYEKFTTLRTEALAKIRDDGLRTTIENAFRDVEKRFIPVIKADLEFAQADENARRARRPLDEKKLLDMLVDEIEDKMIEQIEGTRAHTANVDNYLKAVTTALDDDFNTQFYLPSFRRVREASRYWDVTLGQIETTTILTNNRQFAKVSPAATFEFDLPKRNILITEGFQSAKAMVDEYGALLNDPTFLALGKLYSGTPTTGIVGTAGAVSPVRNVLPGLPTSADEMVLAQAGPGRREFGAALEGLIPDPAIYKFETGTGYEIRPVLAPDGQAVVFRLDFLYRTDVREPVRADEKHLAPRVSYTDHAIRYDYGPNAVVLAFGVCGRPTTHYSQGTNLGERAREVTAAAANGTRNWVQRTGIPQGMRRLGQESRMVAGATADRVNDLGRAVVAPAAALVRNLPGAQLLRPSAEGLAAREQQRLERQAQNQPIPDQAFVPRLP